MGFAMMLRCKCGVKNYLDPYPFWNFKGRTKCAGCDAVYAVEIAGGAAVGEPKPTKGEEGPLVLPGFADRTRTRSASRRIIDER